MEVPCLTHLGWIPSILYSHPSLPGVISEPEPKVIPEHSRVYPQDKTTQNKKESQLMVWGHPTRDVCGCLVNSKETEAERGRSTLRAQQFGWTSEVGENMGLGAQQWQEGGFPGGGGHRAEFERFHQHVVHSHRGSQEGKCGSESGEPTGPLTPTPHHLTWEYQAAPQQEEWPHGRCSSVQAAAAVAASVTLTSSGSGQGREGRGLVGHHMGCGGKSQLCPLSSWESVNLQWPRFHISFPSPRSVNNAPDFIIHKPREAPEPGVLDSS